MIILERVLAFIPVIKQTKQSSTAACASNLDTQMVEAGRITSLSYTVSSVRSTTETISGEGRGAGDGEKRRKEMLLPSLKGHSYFTRPDRL